MRIVFLVTVIVWKHTLAQHEAPYGTSHAYQGPVSTGQGWNSGQSAGSYYHYHVPLVGQSHSHYPPAQTQSNDLHHTLLWLLPLLLLGHYQPNNYNPIITTQSHCIPNGVKSQTTASEYQPKDI
ncbi:unnamed protein product [Allacma fusca]|uniref:Uncharacterized protein n=1 Tax=Allacma fusca TaxID=39272 RepID=A0A8J2LSP4_9HEXA|nr:unnamed protein product [Allacma fusca]